MAGMKSALELAMEKINAQQSQAETTVSLTDAQRQEISDLRKQYDAKIAEKDIMLQADIRQLMQRRPPQEALVAAQELRETISAHQKGSPGGVGSKNRDRAFPRIGGPYSCNHNSRHAGMAFGGWCLPRWVG